MPTTVAEDSFNATRKTSKDINVNYELDSGIEWDDSINQMEDGFKTNLDTWGPFIDDHDGRWVGGMSPEQLLAVNATGILNNITVGGLHSFTPHDVMGEGMSEGWVRSPIQQVEDSEVGMDVYHVQNPQFADLVPGLGVPTITGTAANWTSDYNDTGGSHWEAGMGEYNEWCNYNVVDGLLGSWCADEGAGAVVADNSGNGNDATHNLADWGIGRYGGNNKAVTLDHSYSEVTAGDILPEDSEGNRTGFTVGGWFRSDNIVDQMGTFDLSSHGTRGMLYTQSSGKLLFYAGSNNYVYWPDGTTSLFIDGTYHHLLLSVSGEEQTDIDDVKFFVDGVEHPKWFSSSGGPIHGPYNSLQYGGAYGANGWDGEIDAMVLYDHQLTADEALAVYNVGKPNPDGTFVLAPAYDVAGSADWNTHDPNMMGWDGESAPEGGALGLAPQVWAGVDYVEQYIEDYHAIAGTPEFLFTYDIADTDPDNDGTHCEGEADPWDPSPTSGYGCEWIDYGTGAYNLRHDKWPLPAFALEHSAENAGFANYMDYDWDIPCVHASCPSEPFTKFTHKTEQTHFRSDEQGAMSQDEVFTYSFWANIDSVGDKDGDLGGAVYRTYGWNSSGIIIELITDYMRIYIGTTADGGLTSSGNENLVCKDLGRNGHPYWSNSVWHHWTFTVTKDEIAIYVDGELCSSDTPDLPGEEFYLYGGSGQEWNGPGFQGSGMTGMN
jgi:hypothetical protein